MIRSRLREKGEDLVAEINITPLCDVLLVLLIIFMITASFISQTAIAISTPKASVNEPVPVTPIVVSIDRKGAVYVGKQRVPVEEIDETLKALKSKEKSDRLIIRADKNASYNAVFDVINTAKILEFSSIALTAERASR